jgi:hypothetical protein
MTKKDIKKADEPTSVTLFHGSDDDDDEDLRIPRIKLVQKQSKEMDDDTLNIKPGNLIHTISKEVLEQPLSFIPLKKTVFYVRYNPMDSNAFGFDKEHEPGALIYRAETKQQCGQDAEWVNKNPPLAKRTMNFLSFLPAHPSSPVIIGFSKTSLEAGKDLTSMLKFTSHRKFLLKSESQEKSGNKYHILNVQGDGAVDDETAQICAKIYSNIADKVADDLKQTAEWEE